MTGRDILIKEIAYADGDIRLRGLLAAPAQGGEGRRPGVLLVPAAFGMNGHARDRARMVASLGYVVLAADLYGDGRSFEAIGEAMQHGGPLMSNIEAWHRRLNAALTTLRAQPGVDAGRIAAIGFCLGGSSVLELAYAGADLKAVVSFHGGLKMSDPSGGARVTASVLVCHGANDPLVPDADVVEFQRQMRTGTADWQVQSYGNTLHAFTDPAADGFNIAAAGYNRDADRRSWQAMETLLAERLA